MADLRALPAEANNMSLSLALRYVAHGHRLETFRFQRKVTSLATARDAPARNCNVY
jgi:hypothetical protein